MDSSLYLGLGAVCLVLLSVTLLRRSQQRRATARELTREQLARLREQREVRQSMDELLVQLEEVSGRINAQVDTGLAKLEAALRDADERIARLELPGPARMRGVAPQPAASATTQTQPPSPGSRDERRRRVCELADAGTAPLTIADALQMPVGEVELILNLRKFR